MGCTKTTAYDNIRKGRIMFVKRTVLVHQLARSPNGPVRYKVTRTVNTTAPIIGETLNEDAVKDLIQRGVTVSITK